MLRHVRDTLKVDVLFTKQESAKADPHYRISSYHYAELIMHWNHALPKGPATIMCSN